MQKQCGVGYILPILSNFFFFSSHYTTPIQCWAQDLARGLYSFRYSWVQGCGRMGQTSRCFIVCSSPHSHVVCPSSLNPHFCIRDLHRPVPVRRWFRLDQVGHASPEPGGSDYWDWMRACVVLSGYGWTRESVFECGAAVKGFNKVEESVSWF